MPSIFSLLGALGGLDDAELRAIFNCGIGMVAIVAPQAVETAIAAFGDAGIDAVVVGDVLAADGPRYLEGSVDRLWAR
jgi:phosphoribosylformylglycinamidine cyclo-ligase